METSYEIICAQARKAPRKEYLELLAQPAKITLYTLKDEIANQNKTLNFTLQITLEKLNGIKHHVNKLINKLKNGAIKKIPEYDLLGMIISFKINFKASAKGCSKPQNPTISGPSRLWTEASIFRSAKVKKATAIITGKIVKIESRIFKIIYFIVMVFFNN